MADRNFRKMLEDQWSQDKFVCVGLDSELSKIPDCMLVRPGFESVRIEVPIFHFNSQIVEATQDIVCAYKINVAFYEEHGIAGLGALKSTIEYIRLTFPSVPVILDAKRADIGNTNRGYARAAFDELGADAITVNPYFGAEALQPFLDRKDKGIIVLCRTSNPGASEFQDLAVDQRLDFIDQDKSFVEILNPPLYQYVAHRVAKEWNRNGNCAIVVGAASPEELSRVRGIVGDMPILIPGVGAQGGDVERTVVSGKDSRGKGMIINSSRGIIFASSGDNFAQAARLEAEKLHVLINQYR